MTPPALSTRRPLSSCPIDSYRKSYSKLNCIVIFIYWVGAYSTNRPYGWAWSELYIDNNLFVNKTRLSCDTRHRTKLTGSPLLAHTRLDYINTVTKPTGQERRSNVAPISMLCYPIKRSGRCEAVLQATNQLLLDDGGSVFTAQHVKLIATVFERCCSNMAENKKQCDLTRLLTATNQLYGDFMMNRMKIRYISQPLQVPFEPTKLTDIPNISR